MNQDTAELLLRLLSYSKSHPLVLLVYKKIHSVDVHNEERKEVFSDWFEDE